jgi:hypothetical protein
MSGVIASFGSCTIATPPGLDRKQSRCAIIASAAQDDTNDPRTMFARGAAKEDVDRRSMTVLARAAGQDHVLILQQEMMMRRGAVDAAAVLRLLIFLPHRRQPARVG